LSQASSKLVLGSRVLAAFQFCNNDFGGGWVWVGPLVPSAWDGINYGSS